jgi:anti-sigma-K factor RskA
MAEKYPEVRAEIEAIRSSLVSYAGIYRKNPRPELRASVLEKIDELEGRSQASEFTSGKTGQYYIRPSAYRYLMAAVWLFLVLNIAGNVFFYSKLRDTENKLVIVNTQYEQIKSDMEKKTGELKMVIDRNNKIFDLKGMEMSPESFATVYWNPNTKQVILNVSNLPVPPENMQYQLWALKDGKPFDAGVFDMDSDMHMMDVKISEADAFAVTLEKMGGSPAPTLERLYLMGKI